MWRFTVRLFALFTLFVFFTMATVASAAGPWYAGNQRTSGYGVQGTIKTPSTAPATASGSSDSGQWNWVGATGSSWVQTGWGYFPYGSPNPAKQYMESLMNGSYTRIIYSTISWGGSGQFKVEDICCNNWAVFINGSNKGSFGPMTAPVTMQAFAEVHYSSANQLSTPFQFILYKDSGGTWHSFDQVNWRADTPYKNNITNTSNWTSYGP